MGRKSLIREMGRRTIQKEKKEGYITLSVLEKDIGNHSFMLTKIHM